MKRPHKVKRHRKKRKFFDPKYVAVERRKSNILAFVATWSVISFVGISTYIMCSVQVVGQSMSPTFEPGQRYVLNRLAYLFHPPERGDIVVIRDPVYGDLSVKRIIALPHETIAIHSDHVWINEDLFSEDYLDPSLPTISYMYGVRPMSLKEDQFFILGDNRGDSEDSRFYGPIFREHVVGRVSTRWRLL